MACHALNRERGSAAIELVISLPLLIFLFFMLFYMYDMTQANWRSAMLMRIAGSDDMVTHSISKDFLQQIQDECDPTSSSSLKATFSPIETVPSSNRSSENLALALQPIAGGLRTRYSAPDRWGPFRTGYRTDLRLNRSGIYNRITADAEGVFPGCTGSRRDAPLNNNDYQSRLP